MTDTKIKATLRVVNLDSGNSNPKETRDENPKAEGSNTGKFFLNAWEMSSPRWWPEIFLISCVIGVLIDPLFLYIPVIDEDNKCLRRNETMKEIALVLRSITDFIYILHIIVRLQSASKLAKALRTSILKGLPWSYLLIDILAILPIPQVVVLAFFSKMAGSKSLTSRKFLTCLLLAQYVPRIIRIYVSAKELARDYDSLTRLVWVRGVFNLCLYLIAGHVLGALWYFYSIYWETACWNHACKSLEGCDSGSFFNCHIKWSTDKTKNVTHFNEICPVNPTNEKVYDFGIFAKAMESGILLETTNFPRKFFRCFWWGLRNLSSFGSNLETSGEIWENIFAVIVSILGLVLFLYLIGNLQTYLQFITTKSEEARQKIRAKDPEIKSYLSNHNLSKEKERFIIRQLRRTITDGKDPGVENLLSLLEDHEQLKSEVSQEDKDLEQQNSEVIDKQHNKESFAEWVTKIVDAGKNKKNMSELSAELWISANHIPSDMKKNIMRYLRLRLQEGNQEVDVVNILHILPSSLRTSIKKHLCLDILIKVPMLKSMSGTGYETICKFLKPVTYSENAYIIRKGEPLDMMLFITQGIVWSFDETSMEGLQKGGYLGNELLEWKSKELLERKSKDSTSYSNFPISTKNVKAHTKVEAFALKAASLEKLFNFLVTRLQRRYRVHLTNKQKEEKKSQGPMTYTLE